MIRRRIVKSILLILLLILWMPVAPSHAGDMGLVDLISSRLGVSKEQAEAGAGLIFQLAKQNLSAENFSVIEKAVAGIDQMMNAAPKTKAGSGTLGGISSMLGGTSNKLTGLAGLTGSFEKLGLTGDMVSKFKPLILDYVKNKGGEYAMNLLRGALL